MSTIDTSRYKNALTLVEDRAKKEFGRGFFDWGVLIIKNHIHLIIININVAIYTLK